MEVETQTISSQASDSESPGFRSELTRAWTVGQRIGRYQLGKPLGRGGMGVVYVADDELLGRVVALKVLREDRTGSVALSRVLREAQSLARLSHPNVVQVYDISTYNGQIFIAMEFISGGTLREWLGGEEHRFDAILDVFIQAGKGLAAAHEVGIIHRDFKPDNVLVGVDGRARVADFGLAAGHIAIDAIGDRGSTARDSEYEERLTRAGTILGTPRYMSPEHREGAVLDARADQFSFCVALYEALYKTHPFSDVGVAASPPKEGPLWVWPLLKRGLSLVPDQRFGELDQLLVKLGQNPVHLRWQRLRLVGLLLLSAALAAGLIFVGLNLTKRWHEAALEADASRAYASAQRRIDQAHSRGEPAEAERIFRSIVEDPTYDETQVLAQAWLAQARRQTAAGNLEAGRVAAANAYTKGQTPQQRQDALLTLAQVFERDFDWAGLSQLINLLAREGQMAAEDEEYQRLQGAAAFGNRDLKRAAQLNVDLAQVLAGASSSPYELIRQVSQVEVESGESIILLESSKVGRGEIYAASATPELPELWRHEYGLHSWTVFPGNRPFAILSRGADDSHNRLYKVTAGGLVEVTTFGGSRPTCAAFVDLDGDGEEELYFSTGVDLEIARIDLLHPGASAPKIVVDTWGTLESYGQEMLAVSLDGEPALALALQGFRAHDIRILQHGSDGKLITRLRKKMGTISGIGQIERLGETLLVVANAPYDKDPSSFPPQQPYGEPPGFHLFRVTSDGFEEVLFLPIDMLVPSISEFRASFVSDYNGDGREDLAFSGSQQEHNDTVFFLQREDGSFARSVLGEIDFRGAVELDGDRGSEALISLVDEHARTLLWVLGAGEEQLPTPKLPVLPPALPPAEKDPSWVRRWSNAVDLGRLGLRQLAAETFHQLAQDAVEEASKVAALHWAAAMRAELGDDEGQFAVLQQLIALAPDQETLTQLYRLGRFLGEYGEARGALQQLPRQAVDNFDTEVKRLEVLAAGGQVVDTQFNHPLGAQWVIEHPTSLHRRPTERILEVATSSRGVLAWLPIEWDGSFLELDLDIDLRHTEWGTGFRVDIVPEESPQGQPILSFEVVTSGTSRGGLRPTRILRCLHDINVFNDELFPTNPDIPLHLQAKVRIAPVIGEAGCSLTPTDGGQGINQRLALGSKPTPGAYRVVLRSSIDVPSLLHVDLHGLTVRGASLRKHKQNKLIDSISHALVEEKYRDALALAEDQKMLAGTLAERMMLSEALVHHGRLTEVQATWRELLTSETPKPELDAILTAQLRRSPQLYGSLLSAVSPEQQVRRVTAAWRNFATNHRDRDELRPRFWDAMQNIDIDRSASPKDAVDALRWRARLFSDVGDHQAGLRQLSQALRRLDATPPEDPIRNETWVVALLQAKLAVRAGDRALAVTAIKRARASATMPFVVEDRLRADPEVAALAASL